MKLRIRGNSVRLRLTQSEVAEFGRTGRIEDKVEFGGSSLAYGLKKCEVEKIAADLQDGFLFVSIPARRADGWIDSNETGLEAEQKIGDGKILRILVEKDFACRQERPGEDETDAFPPPPETGRKC